MTPDEMRLGEDDLNETVAMLGLAATPMAPPARLREKVMAAVRQQRRVQFVEENPGILVHRAEREDWSETPYAGVLAKRVAVDKEREMASFLLRMAPGSMFPNHSHHAEEQCLVLEGEVKFGSVQLNAGDFSKTKPGTVHGHVTTEKGCLLFIVASIHDEPLAA